MLKSKTNTCTVESPLFDPPEFLIKTVQLKIPYLTRNDQARHHRCARSVTVGGSNFSRPPLDPPLTPPLHTYARHTGADGELVDMVWWTFCF